MDRMRLRFRTLLSIVTVLNKIRANILMNIREQSIQRNCSSQAYVVRVPELPVAILR